MLFPPLFSSYSRGGRKEFDYVKCIFLREKNILNGTSSSLRVLLKQKENNCRQRLWLFRIFRFNLWIYCCAVVCRVGYSEFFDFHKSFIFFFLFQYFSHLILPHCSPEIQHSFLGNKIIFLSSHSARNVPTVFFSGLKYCIKVFGSSSRGWRKTQK